MLPAVLPAISKRDPENSPEYSEFAYLWGPLATTAQLKLQRTAGPLQGSPQYRLQIEKFRIAGSIFQRLDGTI